MDFNRESIRPRKTWFLFHREIQSGPHTKDEIYRKLDEGRISADAHVWTDGMEDWRPLRETPAFGMPGSDKFGQQSMTMRAPEPLSIPTLSQAKSSANSAVPPARLSALRWSTPRLPRLRLGKWTGGLLILGAIAAIKTFEGSTSATHLLPELSDVSAEDYAPMKAAAAASLTDQGAKTAVAISKIAATTPSIYVASNLSDGTAFEVILEGVPETLLEKTRVYRRGVVELRGGLAKTPAFRDFDGAALPRGEYRIYAVQLRSGSSAPSLSETELRSNLRANSAIEAGRRRQVATRAYFLGGARDANYDRDLKAFHDKAREQARLELEELGQYINTLDGQLLQSAAAFTNILAAKTRPEAIEAKWLRFDDQWQGLQTQITTSVETWKEETLRNEYFHADLYLVAKQLALQVDAVHILRGKILEALSRREPATPKMAEAEAIVAKQAIDSLKNRIALAATLPPTSNGMPQR